MMTDLRDVRFSYQTSPGKGMSKRRFGKVMRRLGRKHGQETVITKDKTNLQDYMTLNLRNQNPLEI